MDQPLHDHRDLKQDLARSASERGEYFLYIRLPEDLDPNERTRRYADPLDDALGNACAGRVTGGGTLTLEDDTVAHIGVDVVVTDRRRGLAIIREVLCAAGAPADTVIEEYQPGYRAHALEPNRD